MADASLQSRRPSRAGHARRTAGFRPVAATLGEEYPAHKPVPEGGDSEMPDQDRYIDARLEGIESKLDARMEAMQRFQERAEDRFERQSQQAEERMRESQSQLDARMESLHADNKGLRRHIWAAVLTAVLGFAGVAALLQNTVLEQGAWMRQSIDSSAQERSEFREAVKSIQATQQSILERLPESPAPASSD